MSARLRRGAQAVILCAVVLTELLPAFSDSPMTIAVVLSRDVAPYRQALRGFEEILKSSPRSYRLYEFNMEALVGGEAGLIEKVRARRPDLILTVGSTATTLVSERVRDIPIVFCMVLPSSGNSSLQGLREARGNMTGASMEIPLKTQFLKVKEVLPNVRRIGVFYNPSVTGPLIQAAGKIASDMGLELVPIAVTTETDVLQSTEDLENRVDVLWSVADSTVFSPQGLKSILLATLRNRIPFVGLSPSFVKAGALLALSVDYEDVGRQSGEQALRIIAGEAPVMVPMSVPRNVSLSVNMNTAKQIEVQIQDEVRQKAEIYF
ncbi:MAG TPA: ABC transporter substrate-binding protein [Candidatus Polarisedimenticolia bacterium]|nr:ABC transporter substrate-binding protein [Candidatus Polarisedimenticolia bacterium]